MDSGDLSNSLGLLTGLFLLWLRLVIGDLSRKGMERLLGRLEWALRSASGGSAFLAGGYRWKHSSASRVNKRLIKPLLTAICFAFVPQSYFRCPKIQLLPAWAWRDFVVFVDAGPRRKQRFWAGFYFPVKLVRTPVGIFGSLGVCIYVPVSRHWLISYSPIHLT